MSEDPCWDELALLGGPLTTKVAKEAMPSVDALVACMRQAQESLQQAEQLDYERKHDAFWATCLALKIHYPPVWAQLNYDVDVARLPNRIHKLYRVARARLATYL